MVAERRSMHGPDGKTVGLLLESNVHERDLTRAIEHGRRNIQRHAHTLRKIRPTVSP